MASKVNSSYYIGNVPVYAGPNSGAHTQNGCLFNFNIRVKPEVNTIGIMVIRTNDPLIHSYDNTTRAPEFELDLSNITKLINLIKFRKQASPTQEANAFIKIGVTTMVKYADKIKMAWVRSHDDMTIFAIETNGQQEQFVVEGFFQNEYLLDTLIQTRDLFMQAKVAEECGGVETPNVPNGMPQAPNAAPGMPQAPMSAPSAPGMAPAMAAPSMPGAPAPMAAPTNYGAPQIPGY